jgi:hypothetical protein
MEFFNACQYRRRQMMPDFDGSDEKQELAADGRLSGVEQEAYVPYPFDSDKIAISSKPIPLATIVRRLERGMIVAAEMQRGADLWDIGRKSRLIESILLKIPLPLFYAAENKENILSIVDGLQRISTIRTYVLENDFGLKGLEFLKDLEGKKFKDLSNDLCIRIEETELQFVIIQPDSPPEIQRNIFKRLNTGGLPLSDQEIRHALYYGPATDLLKELAETQAFNNATTYSVDDSRMAARELVLRFISFLIMGVEGYNKDGEMDNFLCDAMQIVNTLSSEKPLKTGDIFNKRTILCGDFLYKFCMRTVLIAYQLSPQVFSSAQILPSMTSYIFRNGLCDSYPQRMRCLIQEVDCKQNSITIKPKRVNVW